MTPLPQSAIPVLPFEFDANATAFGPAVAAKHGASKSSVTELRPHSGPAVFHTTPAPVVAIDAQGAAVLELTGTSLAGHSLRVLVRDLLELFKVKVVLLVVVTGWGGFHLGALQSDAPTSLAVLLQALLGIGMVSAGAGALNEAMERKSDALMKRTANRPMAASRVSLVQGVVAGVAAVVLGALWLLVTSNLLTAALALLTALLYTLVYTPLKSRTRWATFIGAFPGAMGPMLGWTAARGQIEWPAVALFAILFVWQFPHFMSIAWLYRDDYARAGIRMLPVVQPDGVSTVVVSLLHATIMIPVSLLPWMLGMTGIAYAVPATALGLIYLAYTIRFARILKPASEAESRSVARNLLRVSVLYLPLLFATLMFCATRSL
jgi:protoheme IX farnesyltransferase